MGKTSCELQNPHPTIFHTLHCCLVKLFSEENVRIVEIKLVLNFKGKKCKNVT
jgi:hypothetical protein